MRPHNLVTSIDVVARARRETAVRCRGRQLNANWSAANCPLHGDADRQIEKSIQSLALDTVPRSSGSSTCSCAAALELRMGGCTELAISSDAESSGRRKVQQSPEYICMYVRKETIAVSERYPLQEGSSARSRSHRSDEAAGIRVLDFPRYMSELLSDS